MNDNQFKAFYEQPEKAANEQEAIKQIWTSHQKGSGSKYPGMGTPWSTKR